MILASRGPLGTPLGGFLERLGGLLVLGVILGVLGRCFADSGPSWAVLAASWGPLGRPLGGLLARPGGLLGRLGAILGVLRRCFGLSRPSWAVWAASWGSLDPSWGPLAPRKVTRGAAGDPRGDAGSPRGDATSPRKIGTRGSEPLKNSSGVRTEAQGRVRGPENTPIRASRHGGGSRVLFYLLYGGGHPRRAAVRASQSG